MCIDFRVSHIDVAANLPFAQARLQDFGTNLFAKFRPANPILFGQAPELGHRQAVLVGNALQGFVERGVIDLDTGFLGFLNFDKVEHHAVEQLFP